MASSDLPTAILRTRIKFCGLRSAADIDAAHAAGADAVGFVFHPGSKRHVAARDVAHWLRDLPPLMQSVFLFMDAPAADVAAVLQVVSPDLLQFHGQESAHYCAQFSCPWIKALPMGAAAQVPDITAEHQDAAAFLADSHGGTHRGGGTGSGFDWSLIPNLPRRTLIAGGLQPDNVGALIRQYRPWAVDVSSGIESTPGCKSPRRMRAFAQAVREADAGRDVPPTDLPERIASA